MKKILLIFILLNLSLEAQTISGGLGLGLPNSNNTKDVYIQHTDFITPQFGYRGTLGLVFDNETSIKGAYWTFQIGTKADFGKYLRITGFTGIQLQSFTDKFNSSIFEFSHSLRFHYIGDNNTNFFIGVKHISNAGISKPNIGRNTLEFGFEW